MSKLSDYAKFTKLRLSFIVVLSAALSYALGCKQLTGEMNWAGLGWLVLGGFLVTGASNGFNQIIERELDKLMPRTANRPMPTGRMSVTEGMVVGLIMAIAGVAILGYFLNVVSGLLGASALLLYVFAYTPSKRVTPFAVFIGALPGAIPPMLGWVAATEGLGSVTLPAVMLFAIQFMWQFPHFWAIAWVVDEDYRKAGFRLLPSGERDKASAFQIVVYAAFLIPVSLLPTIFGLSGFVAAGVALLSGLLFLLQAWKLFKTLDIEAARRLMFGSFIYLPVVQLALLIGY
jgi:protoheme IX farnesyltransferase